MSDGIRVGNGPDAVISLHRMELTPLERSEHIAEWVRLTGEKLGQVAQVSERGRVEGRGNTGSVIAAIRVLGIDRTEAQRAVKIDSLPEQAKQAEPRCQCQPIASSRTFKEHRRMSTPTLGSARRMHCWLWLVCGAPACQRARPVALAPFIIRWGADAPIERLRRSAVCSACGHRGALTYTPSWGGSVVGWAPFPVDRLREGK